LAYNDLAPQAETATEQGQRRHQAGGAEHEAAATIESAAIGRRAKRFAFVVGQSIALHENKPSFN